MKTFTIVLAALVMCGSMARAAEDYPARPVTVVMPYRPGGGGETLVRLVMNKVSQDLGQQFVIENRAGAGGTIGAAYVARARPDGYTLLASGLGSGVVAPAIMSVPFDSMKDFAHIALLGGPPPVLVVNAAFEANTLKHYIEIARGRPGGVAFASSGHGTHVHLVGELFKSLTGTNLLHVPYNGGGPATSDLAAGHVPSAFVTLGSVSQYLRQAKVRALAVAAPNRVADFPDVPTFAELGYKELTSITWFGLSGPAGLPQPVALKMNAAVRAAMKSPDIVSKLAADATVPGDLDPEQFSEFFRAEIARWAPIARGAGKAGAHGKGKANERPQ